ncbi:MAG TPA: metalloregulator ArsR/SmtB family transcription factor [Coriobacteriia bacterium]|nr:metalloregulator ArsR/SmtB family transcription factor [Coriobacteriia bacterium]
MIPGNGDHGFRVELTLKLPVPIYERMKIHSYEGRPGECDARIIDGTAVARVSAGLPVAEEVAALTDIFSALADATRLRIVLALAREDLCVCDLASVTGASQSAVSHHLRLLRDRRLVVFRRDGKRAVYRLADEHVRRLLEESGTHAAERP